jgi:murein DD-endopeptidase MepM/ murein hydrolase activator NlpD
MIVTIRICKAQKKEIGRFPLLLFITITFAIFLTLSFLPKDKAHSDQKAKGEKKEASPQKAEKPSLSLKEAKEIIQIGETLSDILSRHGFSPAEIHQLREQVKPVYDLAKIKAGKEIRIYTTQDGTIAALEYDIDDETYLHIQKKEDMYEASTRKLPFETELHMIWGTIEDNLPNAIQKQGEKVVLSYELAEIFAWDVDFFIDLRKGDSFKILFEKKYLRNKCLGYGNILAAEFINQGKRFQAIRFTYPDTKESDYFNAEGESLRRQFLKSPFKYTPRISSRFSHSRLHPIKKVYRPHYGVDYAAKPGTPVQATADGTVLFAGWNGLSGRMIRIRHMNHYETMYLHLQKCYVKKGDRVKGGQNIGEVGQSGEATGPHLDYRIKYGGTYINPLAHRFKPVKPLRTEFMDVFQQMAQNYCLCLDAPVMIFSSF